MSASAKENLYQLSAEKMPEEFYTTFLQTPHVKIEKIVSSGHSSPVGFWYDQEQWEWVLIVQGQARIQFEDKTVELCKGDHMVIPPHQKHRVDWTSPDEETIWLAVFY